MNILTTQQANVVNYSRGRDADRDKCHDMAGVSPVCKKLVELWALKSNGKGHAVASLAKGTE